MSVIKRLLGNTSWMIAQNIYSMFLSLIVGSLSARYLGPSNYGILGYGMSYLTLFTSISKLGLDNIIINEMVKSKNKVGDYLGTILVLRLCMSILCLILIVLLIFVIEPENILLLKVTFFQSIAIVLQIHEVFGYWFQCELKSKYYVIASMIALTVSSIWRICLLNYGSTVEYFALSGSIQALVILLVVILPFIKMFKGKLKYSYKDAKYLLSKSHHFIISSLAITIYMQTDKIMLGKMMGENEVGLYSAAMTIATLWEFVPIAIINSARPVIVEQYLKNKKNFIKYQQYLFFSISIVCILASLTILFLGKWAVLILYGYEYFDSVFTLQLLILSTCLSLIGNARSVWIVAENLNKFQKYMVIYGAIINILANAVFIPLWGLNGAAVSTIISQFFVQFIAPLIWKETRPINKIYILCFAVGINFIQTFLKRKGYRDERK